MNPESRVALLRPFRLWLSVVFLALSGCAGGVSHSLQQTLAVVAPVQIDFAEVHYYATRADAAYHDISDIRRSFPMVTRVRTVASVDVQYFVETDPGQGTQTVSIRGTAEKPNIWQDIETALIPDSILGFPIHRGFQADARAILEDARPHLREDYDIRLTGHSLGGAVAAILGLYLENEGFRIDRVMTFGEPLSLPRHLQPQRA